VAAAAYHIRPRKGAFLFVGKKSAHSHNNMGMAELSMAQKEWLSYFLLWVKREISHKGRVQEAPFAIMYERIEDAMEFLIASLFIVDMDEKARHKLWFAYFELMRVNEQAPPEAFHEALRALDYACFAYTLRFALGRKKEIKEIAEQIWEAREEFSPHLEDALRAAFEYIENLCWDYTPFRAFFCALKEHNHIFLLSLPYGRKPIGHVLSAAAMSKLKDILRAYMRRREEKRRAYRRNRKLGRRP